MAAKLRDLRHIFHAYILDAKARELIAAGDFPGVRAHDAALFQSLKSAGAPVIAGVLDYIRANVRLEPFEKVA